MATVVLADSSALLNMSAAVQPTLLDDLWDSLLERIEEHAFGFPRAVADEVRTITKGDGGLYSWVQAASRQVGELFVPNYRYHHVVMATISNQLGFTEGVSSIDGADLAIVDVSVVARKLEAHDVEFVIASEDCGSHPLAPTMEQISNSMGWTQVACPDALKTLGLDHLVSNAE